MTAVSWLNASIGIVFKMCPGIFNVRPGLYTKQFNVDIKLQFNVPALYQHRV